MRTLFALIFSVFVFAATAAAESPGATKPGLLGVEMRDVTKDEAERLGWDAPTGVWVVKPAPGSPAEQAGLLPDDVVLSLDGIEVESKEAFRQMIGAKGAGSTVRLRVQRQGRSRTLTATLVERPDQAAEAKNPSTPAALRFMLDTGGHAAVIKGITFTPDGKFLVSAGEDKLIRVWDWRTGETVRTIRGDAGPGPEGKIYALALSADGRTLAVAGYLGAYSGTRPAEDEDAHKIRLYDFATGEVRSVLKGHTNVVNALAFSPDGTRLVSGGFDNSAIVWDVASGRRLQVLAGHTAEIYAVGFTPDGRRIVTGAYDNTLRLWNVSDGAPIAEMKGHHDKVYRVAVNPIDGTIASGSNDREVRIWDGATGAPIKVLGRVGNEVGSMSFSRDGRRLLVGTSGLHGPWPCYVFDMASGKQIVEFKSHNNGVFANALSPDGLIAATADFNGRIYLWEAASGKILRRTDNTPLALVGTGAPRWAVGFSPDGGWIAWGSTNANPAGVTPINQRGPLEFRLRLPAPGLSMGEPERVLGPDDSFVRAAASLGPYALTHREGGNYGGSAFLDVTSGGKTLVTIDRSPSEGYRHRSYTFTPDGETIISGGDAGVLMAYDRSGKRLGSFIGHESEVWALAPSPDGRYLISGSADQTVRLWNLKTRRLIVTLYAERKADGSPGEWLAWTPEGYFTGSPGADRLIGWQANRGIDKLPDFFGAGQLRRQFNRPDIVEKAVLLASAEEAVRTSEGTSFKLADLITRPPPRLSVLEPKNLSNLSASPAALRIRLDPVPDPVKRLSVRVNGRVVVERVPNSGEREIALPVPLAKGVNTITVVAGNDIGDTTQSVRVLHEGSGELDKRGTLYVVAVGVEKYPSLNTCGPDRKQSCNLTYSSRDAALFAATIGKAMGSLHAATDVTLLTNDPGSTPPTAANVLRALSRVKNLAAETDTLVVFIAGHGVNDGIDYLFLTTDAARQGKGYDGATVVPWAILESSVFGTRGQRYLFVDTCRSAGAYNAKLGNEAFHNDVTAFTATGQDEASVELSALKQGVFTYAIAEGLGPEARTAAGTGHSEVRASDLARFLAAKSSALIDQYWPGFETDQKVRKPVPHLFQARDAEDHVLTRLD